MNKILVGLVVGAILGVIDGATAWFTPAVRPFMVSIIIGSTVKGVIAGIAAGWYATRVQSVTKGLIFGFVVGLVLAYAVAAMPSSTGEHYYWQIMLPGSVLGAVIGWATQRYGRPPVGRAAATIAMLCVALVAPQLRAAEPSNAQKAFEKMKTLAGRWEAKTSAAEAPSIPVEYSITGAGTVVMERLFAGQPHEMVTMYTVDGDTLIATHYCSGGNQPVLKSNAAKSTSDHVVFDFASITGTKGEVYINGLDLQLTDDGRAEEKWTSAGDHHGRHNIELALVSRAKERAK